MNSRSANKIIQKGGGYETLMYFIGLFVVIFVGIVIYYKTIGYTISFGWDKLFFIFEKKDPIQVDMTVDDKPEATVVLEPQPEPKLVVPNLPNLSSIVSQAPVSSSPEHNSSMNSNVPISSNDIPNGMPAQESQSNGMFGHIGNNSGVFNVSRNIYKYDDAEPLCKAMGAELATYDQLLEAYKKGADWCNYGWIKGQMAVFPTQEKTWEKLQKGSSKNKFACGKPGLNGGFFDNPDLTFGVNCFGQRPAQNESDNVDLSEFTSPPTAEQIEFDKKVQRFREELGNVTVLPFNKSKWSE